MRGVVAVSGEKVFHVRGDVGNDGAGVDVIGTDELCELAFLLVVVIEVVKYVGNSLLVELGADFVE